MAAGIRSDVATSLRIPAATVPGLYYVIARSDWDAQVPEGVETNNVKSTASIKIGADLAISALTTPAGAVAGGTFNVTDTTANQGGGGAGPTATRFYLSVNSTLDATDVLLGSRTCRRSAPRPRTPAASCSRCRPQRLAARIT